VSRWREFAKDANTKPLLTISEQKELNKLSVEDQREFLAL